MMIIQRFLKLRPYVDVATEKLFSENTTLRRLKPGLPSTNSEVSILQKLTEIFEFSEKGTQSLESEKHPIIHIHDPILAIIVQSCTYTEQTAQIGSVPYILAKTLRESPIYYRVKHVEQCPKMEVLFQCASLLSPVYKEMLHAPDPPRFQNDNEKALYIVAQIVWAMNQEKSEAELLRYG